MSDFEKERLATIARNRAFLESLGVKQVKEDLNDIAMKEKAAAKSGGGGVSGVGPHLSGHRNKRRILNVGGEKRRSSRLRGRRIRVKVKVRRRRSEIARARTDDDNNASAAASGLGRRKRVFAAHDADDESTATESDVVESEERESGERAGKVERGRTLVRSSPRRRVNARKPGALGSDGSDSAASSKSTSKSTSKTESKTESKSTSKTESRSRYPSASDDDAYTDAYTYESIDNKPVVEPVEFFHLRRGNGARSKASRGGLPKQPRYANVDDHPGNVTAPFVAPLAGSVVTSCGELYEGPGADRYWSDNRGLFTHPYPVGYEATRTFYDMDVVMRIESGGEAGPVFVVELDGGRKTYKGVTATAPWTKVCVNDLPGKKGTRVSGPRFFGFSDIVTQKMLREMLERRDAAKKEGKKGEAAKDKK